MRRIAAVAVFRGVFWSAMLEMVGVSFTGFTVRRKAVLAVALPSLTVMVMVAVPD